MEGSHTPAGAMSLSEEITLLRMQVKEQYKEIRRLKEENEFPEETSAFFAASLRKSAKNREYPGHIVIAGAGKSVIKKETTA